MQAEQEAKKKQREAFTILELDEVIQLGKGKAPGLDRIAMELIKWMNQQNRDILLRTINSWWEAEEAPKELYYAKVAILYKKGKQVKLKTTDPYPF